MTDENVGRQSTVNISHTHNVADQRVQAHVTELTNESLMITVDQPHPPVTISDKPSLPVYNEAYPPHTAEAENDSDKPLPYVDSSNEHPQVSSNDELHPQVSSNDEPHPQVSSNDEPHSEDNTGSDYQSTVLVPSNQLLFELD